MLRRKLVWSVPLAGAIGAGVAADRWLAATALADGKQDLRPAVTLPVTRVVMFNSGVGYFSRSGEVDGDARVDLAFQELDINDLIKSMVLEDFGGGRVAAVSYDSREPIERTLASFSINLNGDPSLAGVLQQARGERIEVTTNPTAQNQPGKLTGSIVGIELQAVPVGQTQMPVQVLNMWCAEGLRSVRLQEVQQLRFLNPVLESEFRRALEVLARNHDAQKKAVSVHFAGDGKRRVQVGYVIESPIWKTSYRLVLDAQGKGGKPYLQGWAVVENTTDEDWANVRMALISGRPISFKMDLYDPLFVPRPTVEPELFASLRPPTYDGGFAQRGVRPDPVAMNPATQNSAIFNPMFANPNFNGQGLVGNNFAFQNGFVNGGGGFGGGGFGGNLGGGLANNYAAPQMAVANTPQLQQQLAQNRMQLARLADAKAEKQNAANLGAQLAERLSTGAVTDAATAGKLGDYFQYAIDHPVSLARQKSALLPIVGKDIEATRVSIYNPAVQAKHPLLGLRFKNTSGVHLSQGPITVFEGSTYAGDTRVLDVQPGEERLVSYAIDLGTEVDPQNGPGSGRITSVKANKGHVTTVRKVREEKKYRIANRSQTDRTLVIEHPNRTNQQFKLVETDRPIEDTAGVYRFQVAVKAGEEKTFVVNEERDVATTVQLSNNPDQQIRFVLSLTEAPPALKQKLTEALKMKAAWDGQQRDLTQVKADLARVATDQDRIRKNLAATPREAEVYQTYLTRLATQEREIDALTAREKALMASEFTARKAFEDFLANLTD
ncbi:DUF4139 domain-containing protein [Urbifossiella limnaea]|uniref:DUF4139 domain-containing protein n=1 Tax=Urbifossiella limnaea TaxID=2528023 RepID=A0A517XYQ5_9BACT|nr:DUF4139 domain-containing protein [Urbifossiella limnaea]QDU22621.1 hypothetical protein ETAA1_46040 [Urbifossiella limnaea]